MDYEVAVRSECGPIRKKNEDNFYFEQQSRDPHTQDNWPLSSQRFALQSDQSAIFAVCDGMGGEALGDEASYIAATALRPLADGLQKGAQRRFSRFMQRYAWRTNEILCDHIRHNRGLRMGTTVSVLQLTENEIEAFNIGDSPIWLCRGGKLIPLSERHTHAMLLVDMGIITVEEASQHPERHRLVQHLGIFPEEKTLQATFLQPLRLESHDRFLLASDGITEMLTEAEIQAVLEQSQDAKTACNQLVEAAIEKGGRDNCTALLIFVGEISNDAKELSASEEPQLLRMDILSPDAQKWSQVLTAEEEPLQQNSEAGGEKPGEEVPSLESSHYPVAQKPVSQVSSTASAGQEQQLRGIRPAHIAQSIDAKPNIQDATKQVEHKGEAVLRRGAAFSPTPEAFSVETVRSERLAKTLERIPIPGEKSMPKELPEGLRYARDPRQYQLSDDERSRFERVREEARQRQQNREAEYDRLGYAFSDRLEAEHPHFEEEAYQRAKPVEVSSVLEEEQAKERQRQAKQYRKQNYPADPYNWEGDRQPQSLAQEKHWKQKTQGRAGRTLHYVLKDTLWFAFWLLGGFAAAWLLFNGSWLWQTIKSILRLG